MQATRGCNPSPGYECEVDFDATGSLRNLLCFVNAENKGRRQMEEDIDHEGNIRTCFGLFLLLLKRELSELTRNGT